MSATVVLPCHDHAFERRVERVVADAVGEQGAVIFDAHGGVATYGGPGVVSRVASRVVPGAFPGKPIPAGRKVLAPCAAAGPRRYNAHVRSGFLPVMSSAAIRSGIAAVDRYLDTGYATVPGMSSRFAAAICAGLCASRGAGGQPALSRRSARSRVASSSRSPTRLRTGRLRSASISSIGPTRR